MSDQTRKEASAWDDNDDWAYSEENKVDRDLSSSPKFKPQSAKILAKCLRSTTIALGNAMSAYTKFTKLKSVKVSPDGQLGGSGYVQSVKDMRRQYSNVIEALSRLSDTLYDELHAPHWEKVQDRLKPKDKKDVKEILDDVERIHQDPELWAEEEEIEEFGKTDDKVDLTPKEEKEIVEETISMKKASSLPELSRMLEELE